MGGYLTKDGHVDLERAQLILDGLAKQEDAIFRRRKQTEERRDATRRGVNSRKKGKQGGEAVVVVMIHPRVADTMDVHHITMHLRACRCSLQAI